MGIVILDRPMKVVVPNFLPPDMYLDAGDPTPVSPRKNNEGNNPRLFVMALSRACECLKFRELYESVNFAESVAVFRRMVNEEPTEKDRFITVLYDGVHETAIRHGWAYSTFISTLEEARELQANPQKLEGIRVDGKGDIRLEQLIERTVATARTQPMRAFAIHFEYFTGVAHVLPLTDFAKNPFLPDKHLLHRYQR